MLLTNARLVEARSRIMLGRRLLYTPAGEPRLLVPGLVGVLVAFVVALALLTLANRPRTDEQRADALLRSGQPARAERIYAQALRDAPSVPVALSLLEAHARARMLEAMAAIQEAATPGRTMGLPSADAPIPEEELDALFDALPADVALAARFARGIEDHAVPREVDDEVQAGAAREPPVPWTNHLLGRRAHRESKHAEAARFFEKEGVAFADRRDDLERSLEIWLALEDWDTLRARLADPRVAAAAGPIAKYRLAVHDQDWRSAIRWLPRIWMPRLDPTALALSGAAALGWAFFCARLGKAGARPRFRVPMYLAAFALGVLSIMPTVLLIAVEEAKLGLVETGDPLRDALFFVFGVGLREEAAKLLLFAPLLPILRRYGDKLDVLVCGALVGLGFAAEENLGYLAQENLHTGLSRFLTANFFHMAMTGTLASALDDLVSDRERHAADFTRTALFVIGLHGAYDFLLSHDEYGGGYFAMTAFVLLTKMFLDAVNAARLRADRGMTPLHAFVLAVAVVTGVSLAFASVAVGPKAALLLMGSGLLGQALIVYVFVRQLRTM